MAGGAGNIGSAGGMGNASAQPQMGGGGFNPGMDSFGGGMGYDQHGSGNQSFGGGSQGNNPFGMQQQQPYGMRPMQNPFGQMGALSSPGYGMNQFRQQQMQNPNGPSQPTPMQMPQPGSQTPSWAGGYLGQQQMPQQMPQPMGQRPAYMDNPDFQAYQKQEQDLGRQMNEYMQKAPMFQQLQDLQGKMRGFQQPQGQMGDTGAMVAMPAVMPQQGQTQNPYGNIDQMQQQRNMQDQARQQQMWQQATQDDMRAALGHPPLSSSKMDMPSPENVAPEFGNFGERRMGGGFGRRGMGGGYGGRMGGGYGGQMGLQGLASMLQGRRGGF